MNEHADDGSVTVCHANQVVGFERRGYRLREIIYRDVIEHAVETTTTLEHGYQKNITQEVNKPFALREPLFVMVQSTDSTIAEQQDTIVMLQGELSQRDANQREAARLSSECDKRLKQLEENNAHLSEVLRNEVAGSEVLRRSNRKLEVDIGKVRTAVGDLKMKEILGA